MFEKTRDELEAGYGTAVAFEELDAAEKELGELRQHAARWAAEEEPLRKLALEASSLSALADGRASDIERVSRELGRTIARATKAEDALTAVEHALALDIAKRDELAAEVKQLQAELREAKANLALVKTDVDGVWRWQGDGYDHPESLSCPVVMSAATVRKMLAEVKHPAHAAAHVIERGARLCSCKLLLTPHTPGAMCPAPKSAHDDALDKELARRAEAEAKVAARWEEQLGSLDRLLSRVIVGQKDGRIPSLGELGDRLTKLERSAPGEGELTSIHARIRSLELHRDPPVAEIARQLTALLDAFATHAGLDRNEREDLRAGKVPESLGHGHRFASRPRPRHIWGDDGTCTKCRVARGNCP